MAAEQQNFRNGVKVLGTIITEFEQGKKICTDILGDSDSVTAFVDKCVDIAAHLGFDGWLINIENELDVESGEVARMTDLAAQLTSKTRAATDGAGEVIWYDAVTVDGKLDWQDELNDKNAPFFNVCDGIFLNYTWKCDGAKNNLKNSIRSLLRNIVVNSTLDWKVRCNSLKKSIGGTLTGGRCSTDVYVGIDVFGRNCHGGFDSKKSLELIRAQSEPLSVAIFAPGWTYENVPQEAIINSSLREAFLSREYAFWNSLEQHLFLKGPAAVASGRGNQCQLFGTSFHSGCEKVDSRWRFDLSRQQVQSSFRAWPNVPSEAAANSVEDGRESAICCHESGTRLEIRKKVGEARSMAAATIKVPLMVCQFGCDKDSRLAVVIERGVYEAEYRLAVLADGNKEAEIDRENVGLEQDDDDGNKKKEWVRDTFLVPVDFKVVEAFGLTFDRGLHSTMDLRGCQVWKIPRTKTY
jgi:hypothetical protein